MEVFLPGTALGFSLFPPRRQPLFLVLKLLFFLWQIVFTVDSQVNQALFSFMDHLLMATFQFVMAFFGQGWSLA